MRNVTTVLRQKETVGSRRPEQAYVQSKPGDLDRNIRSVTVLQDMFVVNDLLEGYSYIIARSESGYQLTFMLKDGRQVIVAVEPTGDTVLLAQRIAQRLMESGNRLLRLGLGPATSLRRVDDGLIAWRRRQQLIFFGYSEAEILRLGNLSKLTDQRMNELIHSNKLEAVEKSGEERNKMSMIDKLSKRSRTMVKQYYVEGSGLIPVPIGRLNEVPKVIQEFHEQEAFRATLAGIARR